MKNEKGITLVELIVSIAIMSLIFLVTSNFLMFGVKTHKSSENEFIIQSNMRLLSTNINNSIRNSSATFTMYKDTPKDFSDKWNYIMVSKDQKAVIKYEWDESQKKHVASTIMSEVDGTTFRMEYVKSTNDSKENIVQFKIIANVSGKDRILESELAGLNSLQIIDKRAGSKVSNTIAYRFDPRPAAVANSQAAIAMVLDKSGSMAKAMNGGNASEQNQRIFKLKEEANRLIDSLGKNPNIYVSLVPFSSEANNPENMLLVQTNSSSLKNTINTLSPNGGTNTGDGMRRAYHKIVEFNEKDDITKPTKNFMIVLVDGVTTYSSSHKVSTKDFVKGNGNISSELISTKNYSKRYESGAYYGFGNKVDPDGTAYVNLIGSMIKNYKSKFSEGIKVYVIGFSSIKADHGSLGDIANSASGYNKYYEAGDETALRNIFEMIQKDIDDSLWHIGGPQ